jgi:hypothetical protein
LQVGWLDHPPNVAQHDYRSGSAMMDRDGEVLDFIHRSKIIECSNIGAPYNAPD